MPSCPPRLSKPRRLCVVAAINFVLLVAAPQRACSFIIDPDTVGAVWTTFASGSRSGNGTAATLTWSLVPDGTVVDNSPSASRPSNLISFLNTNFGGTPSQTNYTLQPWFTLFEQSFQRWNELSGVTYAYESHDDGVAHPSANGVLGVRGDIRIGGMNIDGVSDVLAFNYFPADGSDQAIDTSDVAYFTSPTNNYRNFRNTVMHELAHGFGVDHVESNYSLLMAPYDDPAIDGPQLDDIRAVQFFFGDANEKSNGGLGNGTALQATPLGTLGFGAGGGLAVGTSANVPGQAIMGTAKDFVSLSNLADVDFYSFAISGPALLSATLTPRGGVLNQAEQDATPTSFNANARNNLTLSILDINGTTALQTKNQTVAGLAETITGLTLPAAGQYYARITGADDRIQLYDLSLSAIAIKSADFNSDGQVTAADLTTWKAGFGTSTGATRATGDATGDGRVDGSDFLAWQRQFAAASVAASGAVPEPNGVALLAVGIGIIAIKRRHY